MNHNYKSIAEQFGQTLDADDFVAFRALLHPECVYQFRDTMMNGPAEIAGSYEKNMVEGKKKLDKLVWGKARIEEVSERVFDVHFTDYLGHQGLEHTYRCKQRVTVHEEGSVIRIEHVDDPVESEKLKEFYQKVGLG